MDESIEYLEYVERRFALDGNAVSGILHDVFGTEMTMYPAECAHCGQVSVFGTMLAFGRDMGTVLRCPNCEGMLMRIAERPDGIWLDMQGISLMRLDPPGL